MNEIRWTAGNGKEVVLKNITEEANMADHTVMNKVDKIEVSLGGDFQIFQGLENGLIKCMGVKIRAPKEAIEMIEAYKARKEAAAEKRSAAQKEYAAHYNKINGMV
jgi:hypothetical protein